jgi:hypothetical protein
MYVAILTWPFMTPKTGRRLGLGSEQGHVYRNECAVVEFGGNGCGGTSEGMA